MSCLENDKIYDIINDAIESKWISLEELEGLDLEDQFNIVMKLSEEDYD
jgi:hypothetical protein